MASDTAVPGESIGRDVPTHRSGRRERPPSEGDLAPLGDHELELRPAWTDDLAVRARSLGVELGDGDDEPIRAAAGTDATTDSVRQYLHAIGQVPLLTPEEEVDLAKRYRAGLFAAQQLRERAAGTHTRQLTPPLRERALQRLASDGARAQERLVTANLRLVVSLARRYLGRGLSLLELVQEGNLGLMRAVEKFDHARGFRFSTYATWWIRQALTRGTANKARAVRLPVHVHELAAKARRAELELLQLNGRDPTDREVAEVLGVSEERLTELRLVAREVTSLDHTIGPDGDLTLGDLVRDDAPGPEQVATSALVRAELAASLAELQDRERGVLELRYGLTGDEPRTLEEIGELYGVTRERIRQIEKRVLAKLRHPAHASRLQDFLDGR